MRTTTVPALAIAVQSSIRGRDPNCSRNSRGYLLLATQYLLFPGPSSGSFIGYWSDGPLHGPLGKKMGDLVVV